MFYITPDVIMTFLTTAGVGKVFIEIADSMPDPGPEANYFIQWFYAFMQKLASNGMKAEASRTGGKVVIQAKSSLQ
jgi:hypothetical protein